MSDIDTPAPETAPALESPPAPPSEPAAAPETEVPSAASPAPAPAPASAPEPPRKTVEAWAAEKSTAPWLFAAARAFHRWAHGTELTEAEFDVALERAGGLSFH